MTYKILGVHVQIAHSDTHIDVRDPIQYFVSVAWQSNVSSCGFSWRCTEMALDHYPTEADVQTVAARGGDVADTRRVKGMFRHLPGQALTD